jgi:hypothetical protein
MGDEVLPRAAPLVGMALAREGERPLHRLAVHRPRRVVAVLLDHGEQVPKQLALVGGQLLGDRVGGRRRVAPSVARKPDPDAVDGPPGGRLAPRGGALARSGALPVAPARYAALRL